MGRNGELGTTARWTWMYLSLSNGDQVAIWDTINEETENSCATVLHPDGSYELVSLEPLAEGADEFWTSPNSGMVYPTRWHLQIPSLKADFRLQITGPKNQELGNGTLSSRYDAPRPPPVPLKVRTSPAAITLRCLAIGE